MNVPGPLGTLFAEAPGFVCGGPGMRCRRGAGMMQPKLEYCGRTGGLGDNGELPTRYLQIAFVDAGFVGIHPEAEETHHWLEVERGRERGKAADGPKIYRQRPNCGESRGKKPTNPRRITKIRRRCWISLN